MIASSVTVSSQWVSRAARPFAFANAAVFAVAAYVLCVGPAWVVNAWPWPAAPMSFVFLGSIAASISVVWLSVALANEPAALAGVGVNIVVAAFGASVLLAQQAWVMARGDLALAAVITAVACAFGVWLWRATRRLDVRDRLPLPAIVRWAFIFFVVALTIAGSALVLQNQVFPWRLWNENATLFGFVFLGAAAYFAYAVVAGRWAFAAPALWGFLAYDLVLFVPYFRLLFGNAGAANNFYGGDPINRVSLVIYLAVLSLSALLALYAALLHPATRLWAARTASTA